MLEFGKIERKGLFSHSVSSMLYSVCLASLKSDTFRHSDSLEKIILLDSLDGAPVPINFKIPTRTQRQQYAVRAVGGIRSISHSRLVTFQHN